MPRHGVAAADGEPLAGGFTAPTRAAWEALARAGAANAEHPLTSVLEDAIEVGWLYSPDDALAPDPGGVTGVDPFVRGRRLATPWAIRQQHATPDRRAANREILDDLEGGGTELLLVIASPEHDGIAVTDVDELAEVLEGVQLELAPVALAAGTRAAESAELLLECWRRSGQPPAALRGSLRLDPIGTAARIGEHAEDGLAAASAAALAIAADVRREFPAVLALAVDATPYVEAGAGASFELALALATALAYLRAGEDAGLDAGAVAAALEFTLVAGPNQFLEIAKLRAARRLWATVLAHCDVPGETRQSALYVRTSQRMVSALDPWVNLLRATSAVFAAAVGGADGITVLPFDEPVAEGGGTPGALGRRMARNTQLLLLEEASVHHVADPAGGSWYVESLTDQLARDAWAQLQEIERMGGIGAALASGEVRRRVGLATAERQDDLTHRRRLLTGVNAFPSLEDDGLERAAGSGEGPPDPPTSPAAEGGGALTPVRDGAQFEALRARALRIAAAQGSEPTILLACMGSLSDHVTVAQWAGSFFEAGGVRTLPSGVQPDAAAHAALLAEHGLGFAAVCPGRDAEPAALRALVDALRAAGARAVYLAGAAPEAAAAAGADVGVRDGADMVAVLGELLDRFAKEPE